MLRIALVWELKRLLLEHLSCYDRFSALNKTFLKLPNTSKLYLTSK